jgi:tRNA A37 methylthiotransferase MiaB
MLKRSVFPCIDEDKKKPTTKQDILQEVEVLVRNGQRSICLHSEDTLFYGRAGWEALT